MKMGGYARTSSPPSGRFKHRRFNLWLKHCFGKHKGAIYYYSMSYYWRVIEKLSYCFDRVYLLLRAERQLQLHLLYIVPYFSIKGSADCTHYVLEYDVSKPQFRTVYRRSFFFYPRSGNSYTTTEQLRQLLIRIVSHKTLCYKTC